MGRCLADCADGAVHFDRTAHLNTVTHVVGARPNLMKAAPVMRALARAGVPQRLLHTGQHYDEALSRLLLEQLRMPPPDINLQIGSGTHAEQTAAAMRGLEADLAEHRPAVLVVYGDVNSSMAGAVAAAKMQIPIAHVEAGVRSFDRSMPEEINRLVIDRLSTSLLTPSPFADENLRKEGIDDRSIHCVGNVMIDSLMQSLTIANADGLLDRLQVGGNRFVLVTLHRAGTVDDPRVLGAVLAALGTLAADCPVIFPVHPRTRKAIGAAATACPQLHLLEPVGYLEFIALQRAAAMVITDSGGIQVETSFLGVPCLTYRETTEWPETLRDGTNTLVGRNPERLLAEARHQLTTPKKTQPRPTYWDGRAAERIAQAVVAAT